ncbi:MAG: DUF1028 domain-containing protein [Akkermansiaceae bacterium]|nr:DUF1028 domain-containing protein [Akkermansiaceae bacterium]
MTRRTPVQIGAALLAAVAVTAAEPLLSTFSIVACDPETGELGVAVASKFPAVGAVVPWARAGVGAVATQSAANTTFGPDGLALLARGTRPEEALEILTRADPGKPRRQAGIVDAAGRTATFTGAECLPWAGGRTGKNFAVQGNLLAGPEVVDAMARAFKKAAGPLADRLLAALTAGQAAGGDRRGRQSAALLVVRKGWGYGAFNDRFRDLRVDDHPMPIAKLRRVLEQHRRLFPRPRGSGRRGD